MGRSSGKKGASLKRAFLQLLPFAIIPLFGGHGGGHGGGGTPLRCDSPVPGPGAAFPPLARGAAVAARPGLAPGPAGGAGRAGGSFKVKTGHRGIGKRKAKAARRSLKQ